MSTTEGAEPQTATPRTATLRCQFCQSWNRVDVARAADRPKCGSCGRPMLLDRPIRLDDETFARTVAESAVPVLVDFHADWCGPCKTMAPAVDALAARVQGRALVAKVDTDRSPATAQRFDIRAIPTVIVFQDGREARRQAGAVPLGALEQMLPQ